MRKGTVLRESSWSRTANRHRGQVSYANRNCDYCFAIHCVVKMVPLPTISPRWLTRHKGRFTGPDWLFEIKWAKMGVLLDTNCTVLGH
jgi:hypothetical protein